MSKKKFTKRKKERKEFFITAVKGEWQLIISIKGVWFHLLMKYNKRSTKFIVTCFIFPQSCNNNALQWTFQWNSFLFNYCLILLLFFDFLFSSLFCLNFYLYFFSCVSDDLFFFHSIRQISLGYFASTGVKQYDYRKLTNHCKIGMDIFYKTWAFIRQLFRFYLTLRT